MTENESKLIDYAAFGDINNVSKLINEGTDINTPSNSSFPLFEAISKGHLELVGALLKKKNIDLNRYDKNTSYTALHAAIFYSHYRSDIQMLGALLKDQRIDINCPSKAPLTFGFKAIHIAAFIGYTKGVELLLQHGSQLSDSTQDGLSVFDIAGTSNSCTNSRENLLEILNILAMQKQKVPVA